jgi:predicted dehydrogenase
MSIADGPVIAVGLVGTGGIAKLHPAAYSLVPVYYPAPSPAPEKLVICDVDDDSARAGARRLGWPEWTGDYRALVERPDVDLVDITTPNHLHADVAIAAAENGKMIVCEKPLSTDLDGARRMYEAVQKAGVPTAVNFQKRRHPAVMHARKLLESGAIGDVFFYHGTYRQPFGRPAEVVDAVLRSASSGAWVSIEAQS